MSEWIDKRIESPRDGQLIKTLQKNGAINNVVVFDAGCFKIGGGGRLMYVTHWMPR